MLAITQFEVYVLDHGRWTIHARYGSDQRKAAVMDARNTEFTTGLPTKVISETYFPEVDEAELVTVYISPKARERREAAKSVKRVGRNGNTQRLAHTSTAASGGKRRRVPLRPGVNVRQYLFQGVVAAAFSLVAATLSTVVLSWGLRRSIESGLPVSAAMSDTIVTYSYAVFFLFFFMSLFRSKLPLHRMLSYIWQQSVKTEKPEESPQAIAAAIAPRLRPKQPAAAALAEAARALDELKLLRGDPTPEPEPVYVPPPPMPEPVAVEPPPVIEVLSEKEKKKREKKRKEEADKAAKAAAKAAADEAAARAAAAAAAAAEAAKGPPQEPMPLERAVMRRFVTDVVKPATAGTVPDDPVTRRGVSLVIAGAAAALAETARTTPAGRMQLIEEALKALDVNSASIAMFMHQHDELIANPANAALVTLGRSALAKHLEGVDVARILAVALAGWRTPHGQPTGPAPAAEPAGAPPVEEKPPHDFYLLTELRMGSAFVMTAEGVPDNAAEAARDAAMGFHNSVVRSVLGTHAGHEVKHTGMGIFAQFKDAGVAVAAASEMQRRFTASYGPKLAVAVIAKNDNDDDPLLTPNVVRQAQTVAAHTSDGEIVVEKRVRKAAGLDRAAYGIDEDDAALVKISASPEADGPALYEHSPGGGEANAAVIPQAANSR